MPELLPGFATCPRGIESLLLAELRELGAGALKETVAGVGFEADMAGFYRICLWSRLASRVLLPLVSYRADSDQALYDGARAVAWEDHLATDGSLAVDFTGTSDVVRHTRFGAMRIKDAVVDRLRTASGERPSVDRQRPDLRINAWLHRDRLRLSLDLSGDSLHRRGYRQAGGAAPLKENLAAALLVRAGWPAIAARGGALIDPMCGSGTLLAEGLLMALDRAPGLTRTRFGFTGWLGHVPALWRSVREEAEARARAGLERGTPPVFGYDAAGKAAAEARDTLAHLGFENHAHVRRRELAALVKPTHQALQPGLLITNPPYGERLGDEAALTHLYRFLGERLRAEFAGWRAAVFTGNPQLGRAMQMRPTRQYRLMNGAIRTRLLLFEVNAEGDVDTDERTPGPGDAPVADRAPAPRREDEAAHVEEPARDAAAAGSGSTDRSPAPRLSEGARMVANRLGKNARHLARWQRRAGVDCWRVYDADIPEYAVAIDRYGDWAHVAEYQPPRSVSPELAETRLRDVLAAIPDALGIPAERIVLKQRERQRGSRQYARRAQRNEFLEMRENDARLLVNLHDYLDTGLFLDHRPVRRYLRENAEGLRFANLFCYTATASVQAALGGARVTTSVDTSRTYLDWARRNLALNGLSDARHHLVRADCRQWLTECDDRFDLVLLDPPTFSNSKGADTFDVQRDQGRLIADAMRIVAPDGLLIFSNNRRGFRLEQDVEAAYQVEDRTRWSMDEDFRRPRQPHQCWFIRHR